MSVVIRRNDGDLFGVDWTAEFIMTIKELINLLPPLAVYHIIRRSIEYDRKSRKPLEVVAVGWKPDESYRERVNGNGVMEFYKKVTG